MCFIERSQPEHHFTLSSYEQDQQEMIEQGENSNKANQQDHLRLLGKKLERNMEIPSAPHMISELEEQGTNEYYANIRDFLPSAPPNYSDLVDGACVESRFRIDTISHNFSLENTTQDLLPPSYENAMKSTNIGRR